MPLPDRHSAAQFLHRDRIVSVIRRRASRVLRIPLAVLVAIAGVVTTAGPAAAAEVTFTFDGGGWGHGVGMPQYAARGQADDGMTHEQILAYWYQGTGLTDVGTIDGVPNPIRVGINYVLVGSTREYRPFRWQEFSVVQDGGSTGVVTACLPGEAEGSCSITIDPGVTWRYQWFDAEGGFCSLIQDPYGAKVTEYSHATACEIRLYWTDQPHTRLSFPGGDVARTFARGHIAFLAPKTVNGQTGFHFNVVLDLDEYVYGLAEMPVSWPSEALEAQVVAARTYAARKAKSGLRADCSCHVVWDTFDQSYKGWHSLNEGNVDQTLGQRWRDAVDNTAGQVVVYPSGSTTMAGTFYGSSTGGASENAWDVWGPDTPSYRATYAYLATQPDTWSERFAGETSTIRWSKTMTAKDVAAALGLDQVLDITIVSRYQSGSPQDIRVEGLIGSQPTSLHLTGGQLRSALGLRSHFIHTVTKSGGTGGGTPADLAASVGVHDAATGIFTLLDADSGGSNAFYFGNPADIPYSGDWNCDGVTTLGLYRVSAGYLFLRNSNTQGIADIEIYYGNPGDIPIAGDWNGNDCETVGIYRPSQRKFYLRNSNTQGVAEIEFAWGNSGDVPLAGDWDGDGVTTVGLYRPSTKMLYLTNGFGGQADIVYQYSGAQAGDRIIVGDWDGDGRDTVGVYRPATATFYLRNSYTAPGADHIFVFGQPNRSPVSGHWG